MASARSCRGTPGCKWSLRVIPIGFSSPVPIVIDCRLSLERRLINPQAVPSVWVCKAECTGRPDRSRAVIQKELHKGVCGEAQKKSKMWSEELWELRFFKG